MIFAPTGENSQPQRHHWRDGEGGPKDGHRTTLRMNNEFAMRLSDRNSFIADEMKTRAFILAGVIPKSKSSVQFCVLAQTFSLLAPGKAFKSLLTTSITILYAGLKFGTLVL